MRCIAVDEKNDMYIGENGNLALNSGIDAIMQACANAVKAQLGEMILETNRGIPNFQTVWNGAPNIAQFEAFLRRTILEVEGVTNILNLTTRVNNGTLFYEVDIQTIYGSEVLNGEL